MKSWNISWKWYYSWNQQHQWCLIWTRLIIIVFIPFLMVSFGENKNAGSNTSDALPSLFIPLWNLRAIKWENKLRYNFTILQLSCTFYKFYNYVTIYTWVFQLPYFLFKSILEYWTWNSSLGMSRFRNLVDNIFLQLFLKTWLFLHGFIFYKMTIFTNVHFINVLTLLCILIIIAKIEKIPETFP